MLASRMYKCVFLNKARIIFVFNIVGEKERIDGTEKKEREGIGADDAHLAEVWAVVPLRELGGDAERATAARAVADGRDGLGGADGVY